MFSLSLTAKMSWQDPAGLTVLVFSRALIYTHLSLPELCVWKDEGNDICQVHLALWPLGGGNLCDGGETGRGS